MELPATSSLVLQKRRAGLEIKAVHRSPQACLYCRSRKVRCDVSKNGQPCMNCNLDEQKCVVTKRASRRFSNGHSKFQACPQPDTGRRKTTRAQEPIIETITELDIHPQRPSTCDQPAYNDKPNQSVVEDHHDTPTGKNAQSDTSGTSDSCYEATPAVEPPATDLLSSFFVNPGADQPPEPSEMVVYCSYSFLAISNMFYVPAQDVRFLDKEDCFRLPARSILDQAIQQYFLHVHPLLPMLSEADFWEAYYSPAPEEAKKTSLLLIQAMLFVSCNFLPLESINRLGYSNVRSARASFYRKAKLIYDFGVEPSSLATAQAALLLTFWTPPLNADSKPNTSWLMIAIENARRTKADYYSDISNLTAKKPGDHAILRRLWWCCIIRDRILPLGLRRSILITPAHFDFKKNMELGSTDLQAEICRSNMYNAETKTALANVAKRLLKLSVILTDVLLLLYPLQRVNENCQDTQLKSASLRKCKEDLLRWYTETPITRSGRRENIVEHKSVTMHTTLMYIYYHGAAILLCHDDLKLVEVTSNPSQISRISQARQEVQHSIACIADLLDRLNQLHVARWLPITIVAYAAFPLAVHILDAQFPRLQDGKPIDEKENGQSKQRQLSTLIKAMKVFHEQYDGVEDVVKTIRNVIRHIQLHVEISSAEAAERNEPLSDSSNWDLLLALAIDWSLSTGKSADGQDFTTYLGGLFSQPKKPPGSSINVSTSTSEGIHRGQHSPLTKEQAPNFGMSTPSSHDDEFEHYRFVDSSLLSGCTLGDDSRQNGFATSISPHADPHILGSVWDGMILDNFVGVDAGNDGTMTWDLHAPCDGHDQVGVRTGQLLDISPEADCCDSLSSPFVINQ
ncbi:fungal-specific transcription factor domain-containing protein [Ilyonectria sp. MPI-CAGE-AT-0026]|nr:fungal-specific transcription factor domain-containing protein [Ilyonectria sp. MPI-CAGE-AT-0026]